MASLDFAEVAALLNCSRTTEINPLPVAQLQGQWALYDGRYHVHTMDSSFQVLYLTSRASKESVEQALRNAMRTKSTQIVYANSLPDRIKSLPEILGSTSRTFSTTEYIRSFILDELATYRRGLEDLAPKFYVDPHVRTPDGFQKKLPNPLLPLLQREDVPRLDELGRVGILLAEPGQGKTYMSQYLAATLSKRGLIPIYIRSSQWGSIALDDLRELTKTIAHSFRHFGSPIGWLAGCEDRFLDVTLRAGLFCIIFDGFDEYVLWNKGRISAADALGALVTLSESTGSRIVVTSRTSFWQSEVEDDKYLGMPACVSVYQIEPFDLPQATNYFNKRLVGENAQKAAKIYSLLSEADHELAGRGFVLSLIADLVSHDGEIHGMAPRGTSIVSWLLENLCEREFVRQQLPLSASDQLAALRVFVAEVARGSPPTRDTLSFAIDDTGARLLESDKQDCMQKMRQHPILREAKDGTWSVTDDQIGNILLAEYIVKNSAVAGGPTKDLEGFARSLRSNQKFSGELASTVVDVIRNSSPERFEEYIRSVVAALISMGPTVGDVSDDEHSARHLAVAITMATTDVVAPNSASKIERTQSLLSFLPEGQLRELPFFGTLARFDFSGVTFDRCRFERVTWANCELDQTTVFDRCVFVGGRDIRSPGIGSVKWSGCTPDNEAASWIASAQIASGRRQYSGADLKIELGYVVKKFVGRGGVGVRTVKDVDVASGTISRSRYKDLIIEELERAALDRHSISGVGDGYNVKEDSREAVRFYVENNVFTGPLRDTYDRLCQKLNLDAV